ncbi:hypothetical protein BVC80_331g3 [Macleaya cordata]|uniref:Knr4/Smi1-like domain-containing protein n=1 Tax=Macleaya cordata TaxID=56857 RepID=A0A200QCC8_MACCD|nr:hypothetical protein BVC80_331g3 [Macleaya cordata]
MAMSTITTTTKIPIDPNPRRVIFSFAAYAKKVISHLKTCKIHITEGLTDDEISSIEESFGFIFPPDLRSILNEGLPVGPEFPNWRSSSSQQLEILINLPILGICREITKRNLWFSSWGNRPDDPNEALTLAKKIFKKAPILVPIYRHCYIPSSPNLAGNPIIFVKDGDLRYFGFDVAGFFFQEFEFRERNNEFRPIEESSSSSTTTTRMMMNVAAPPAWAVMNGGGMMKIEFWSDLVESSVKNGGWNWVLEERFEEMKRCLRKGGWSEEEVSEMITTTSSTTTTATTENYKDEDDSDEDEDEDEDERSVVLLREKESVIGYMHQLSVRLLRSGWSREDISYSFGIIHDHESGGGVLRLDVDSYT